MCNNEYPGKRGGHKQLLVVGPQLCLSTFARSKHGTTVRKSTYTDMILWKCILLIVQYKYIRSFSGDFYSPESDPPHKIMLYSVYYSTRVFDFQLTEFVNLKYLYWRYTSFEKAFRRGRPLNRPVDKAIGRSCVLGVPAEPALRHPIQNALGWHVLGFLCHGCCWKRRVAPFGAACKMDFF